MAVIDVEHVHKRYGEKVAVEDVSFTVEEGEIFGILGRNGAGKTTTVECAVGLRRPDGGLVRVLGMDPRRDGHELRQQVGVQLQESELPDKLTVAEAIDLYASFYRTPADGRALLSLLGLAEQARHQVQEAVRRPEAAAVDRAGADRPAPDRRARRAHDRARPRGPPRHLGADRGHPPAGGDHRAGQPLHGRGRTAVRPGGHHRGRAGRGHRQPGRAGRPGSAASSGSGSAPPAPLDGRLLADLPEVTSVTRTGDTVVVTGTADALMAVTSALARRGVVAHELRVDQPSLEDAFVAVTSGAGPSTEI